MDHVGGEFFFVFVILEVSVDVLFHRYINIASVVVPDEVENTVYFALPVDSNFVVSFDGVNEVLGVIC